MADVFTDKGTCEPYFIDGYEIFFGPYQSHGLKDLSPTKKNAYLSLLEKAQLTPRKILAETKELEKQIPSVPEVDNLLTYILLQNKCFDEAKQRIITSHEKYPDYFFARINYGDMLLQNKNIKKFKELFPFQDLKEYFPDRIRYHISEYRSFILLMCRYFLLTKDKKTALIFYHKAYAADPAHPSVAALEGKLFTFRFLKKYTFSFFYRKLKKSLLCVYTKPTK